MHFPYKTCHFQGITHVQTHVWVTVTFGSSNIPSHMTGIPQFDTSVWTSGSAKNEFRLPINLPLFSTSCSKVFSKKFLHRICVSIFSVFPKFSHFYIFLLSIVCFLETIFIISFFSISSSNPFAVFHLVHWPRLVAGHFAPAEASEPGRGCEPGVGPTYCRWII